MTLLHTLARGRHGEPGGVHVKSGRCCREQPWLVRRGWHRRLDEGCDVQRGPEAGWLVAEPPPSAAPFASKATWPLWRCKIAVVVPSAVDAGAIGLGLVGRVPRQLAAATGTQNCNEG